MPLVKGKSQGAFKQNVRTLMGEIGKSPHVQSRAQAIAIAYSKKRSGKQEGGAVGGSQSFMPYERPMLGRPNAAGSWPIGQIGPGRFQDVGQEIKDASTAAYLTRFLQRFRVDPERWNAWLLAQPLSRNIEDRRQDKQEGGRVVLPQPPDDPAYIKAMAAYLARRKKAMADAGNAKGGRVEEDGRDLTPSEHVRQAFQGLENPAFRQSVTEMDAAWPRDYRFPLQFMPGTDVVRGQSRPMWMQPGRPITDPTLGITSPRDVRALQGGGPVYDMTRDWPRGGLIEDRRRFEHPPSLARPLSGRVPIPWRRLSPDNWPDPDQVTVHPELLAYQGGGALKPINPPWYERSAARYLRSNVGLVNSGTPGRADAHKTSVPSGSYVIPAATLSALGQGNTMSGFNVLKGMFSPGRRFGSRMTMPKLANGGSVGDPVPVMLSGGEAIVFPHAVARVGNGDIDKGHDYLDKWVTDVRDAWAKKLKSLPPPVKG